MSVNFAISFLGGVFNSVYKLFVEGICLFLWSDSRFVVEGYDCAGLRG